jgi:hypothetical protein
MNERERREDILQLDVAPENLTDRIRQQVADMLEKPLRLWERLLVALVAVSTLAALLPVCRAPACGPRRRLVFLDTQARRPSSRHGRRTSGRRRVGVLRGRRVLGDVPAPRRRSNDRCYRGNCSGGLPLHLGPREGGRAAHARDDIAYRIVFYGSRSRRRARSCAARKRRHRDTATTSRAILTSAGGFSGLFERAEQQQPPSFGWR